MGSVGAEVGEVGQQCHAAMSSGPRGGDNSAIWIQTWFRPVRHVLCIERISGVNTSSHSVCVTRSIESQTRSLMRRPYA
jgi:hypothetical protein